MQPLCVDPDVDTDDFVVAGAGLGVDLAREEGRSVGGDVPAVLQEESLQVVHLFTHPLAGAQGLSERERKSLSIKLAVGFHLKTERKFYNESFERTLYSCRILLVQWYALLFTLDIGTIDFRFSSLLKIKRREMQLFTSYTTTKTEL